MDDLYDLAVIGFGPAGEVLASTVGESGFKVLVVERWPTPYPLPRLTTLDGECCRIVQNTCLDADAAFAESSVQDACHFVDATGDPLMVVRYPGKIGGWPSRLSIFQPDFERQLAAKVESMPNVCLRRGWEAVSLSQDSDGVAVEIAQFNPATQATSGPRRKLRARYLVATDGTRSFVRDALNVPMRDFKLHERWLNFDAELKRPVGEHLMRKLMIYMDPVRPHMHMPIGTKRLRLEFRVMESETDTDMCQPAAAWEFLTRKHGIGPDDVTIMRQVVYHYHTRITTQWRIGRVFLAGDSAHTMPPYMGQGGCAAIRDGRNLGWKLVEVLSGRSREALLDEYGTEREPHVTTIVLGSDNLSRIVNMTDPQAAMHRNEGMRKKGEGQPPELPRLTAGVLHREVDGSLQGTTGETAPQGLLIRNGKQGRGDDLIGSGFQLWCLRDPLQALGGTELAWLEKLGCRIAVFDDQSSRFAFEDVEGVYRAYLKSNQVQVMLLRPDFFVFGAGAASSLNALIRELAERLHSVAPPASGGAGPV